MSVMIISFDCEGKWGMADHLSPYLHEALTDRSLAEVYRQLTVLLAEREMPATFAYVMAFLLTPTERSDLAHLLERNGRQDPWMEFVWHAWEGGLTQGWFQPEALEVVRERGEHEIACHGFCHRPLGDHSISRAGALAEMDAALHVARLKRLRMKTLVYPRNEVGHQGILRDCGFLGYREKLARPPGWLGRQVRVLEEFNVFAGPQPFDELRRDGLIAIPPGYFFNWRFGIRRHVPESVTVARWKGMLDRACAVGGVVHLWLHPHNLITAPATFSSLGRVLDHAARLRDRGHLEMLTQEQYCQRVSAGSHASGRDSAALQAR